MKKILCLLIICFVACEVFAQESGGKDAVLAVRSVYQKSLDKINSDAFTLTLEWTLSYKTSLENYHAARQKAGDLEGCLAAKSELDRFLQTKTLSESNLDKSSAAIINIQKEHLKSKSDLLQDRNSKIVAVTDNYCQHLLSKQTNLTKENKIEEATAFNEELNRVKDSDVYIKAQAFLSGNESAGEAKPDTAGKKDVAEATAKPDKGAAPEFPPGFNVYKFSERSEKEKTKDLTFKPLILRPSGIVSRNEGLGCNVEMSKDSSSSKSSTYYSSTISRANTRAVKLTLKKTLSSAALTDLIVILQYYSKPINENSKNLFKTQIVRIPQLEKEPLIIECPEFSLSKSRSSYYGNSGSEFYGLMVSVLKESEKKLLYQGISASGLAEFGASVLDSANASLEKQKLDELFLAYRAAYERAQKGEAKYTEATELRRQHMLAVEEYNNTFPETPYTPPVP